MAPEVSRSAVLCPPQRSAWPKTHVAHSCFLQNSAFHDAQPSSRFLGQQSPFTQRSACTLHENASCGERGSGVGEVWRTGPRGSSLRSGEGLPSLHRGGACGHLVLSYPICPGPTSPASCSALALLTQDLVCPRGQGDAHRCPQPGSGPFREAAHRALLQAQRWGDGRPPPLHPGGPGSPQAVGLQLQTPKHILWEVSLACGWGIPLFR